jgi:hypothetical protein
MAIDGFECGSLLAEGRDHYLARHAFDTQDRCGSGAVLPVNDRKLAALY